MLLHPSAKRAILLQSYHTIHPFYSSLISIQLYGSNSLHTLTKREINRERNTHTEEIQFYEGIGNARVFLFYNHKGHSGPHGIDANFYPQRSPVPTTSSPYQIASIKDKHSIETQLLPNLIMGFQERQLLEQSCYHQRIVGVEEPVTCSSSGKPNFSNIP